MLNHREGSEHVVVALTAAERRTLGERASLLAALRHPGLVDLIEAVGHVDGCSQLRLRWVGPDLTELDRRPEASEVAGLGAAAANILGDLHALGLIHGAVRAEHILLDPDGRPVLCGVGSSRRTCDQEQTLRDAAELVGALTGLMPDAPTGKEWRRLQAAMSPGRRHPPTVGHLARRLADPKLGPRLLVPTSEGVLAPARPVPVQTTGLPVPPSGPSASAPPEAPAVRRLQLAPDLPSAGDDAPTAGPRRVSSRRRLRRPAAVRRRDAAGRAKHPGAAFDGDGDPASEPTSGGIPPVSGHRTPRGTTRTVAATAVAGVVAVLLLTTWASGPGSATTRAVPCPAVDRGCRALPATDGVLTTPAGRFAVGSPGDVVVLGRWDCGPVGLPAVLVPSDGEVWAFDRWPTAAAAVAGRPIGRIPDAATLVVVPAANGCDRLTVVRHRGAPIQLQPGLTP